MLEVVLALSVLAAVVIVGLLISIGNERQRRALDKLREDVRNWALGDLEVKRERAAREIQIMDPLAWFRDATRKATGIAWEMRAVAKVLEQPEAVVVASENGSFLMFSPVRPERVRKMLKAPAGRSQTGPLPSEMRMALRGRSRMETYELSALNAGIFFDLEADRVWRMLTDRPLKSNQLWLYEFRSA
jgi:hypothetical protein